jgi:hypothetical protein
MIFILIFCRIIPCQLLSYFPEIKETELSKGIEVVDLVVPELEILPP